MPWTYPAIMLAAVTTGFVLFRRTAQPLGLTAWEKLGIALGAFCGGMIGAKLPFVLADWEGFLDGTAWLDDGKTIMAGLVGGYLGAQLAEWALGVRTVMCDVFAMPLAAAVAIGRLACFSAGCCHGTPTSLPWGVDFGDGLLRHPTQLYESAFHLCAAVALYQMQRRGILQGHLIRIYLIAYFVYRFATEFIRPEVEICWGLTGYQLAALVLAPFFALWCCPGCRPWHQSGLSRFSRHGGPSRFSPGENGTVPFEPRATLPKATRTLCPTCLQPLLGTTFEKDGKVYLERECSQHGRHVALVSSDRRHHYLRHEVSHPATANAAGCCSAADDSTPDDSTCGHPTCVALLEITEACNLQCPVCYAQSSQGDHRPLEDLRADLDAFLATRGSLDVLQLSGGEPLLHPDLLAIVDHVLAQPIDRVMINTNGLALLTDATLAGELARRKPRLELYLQLDGLDAESHLALRGADLCRQKQAVLETIREHDLPTTLVCTVARGVNEDQLGRLLRLGLETPQLRGITFQPATFCGRYRRETDALDRATLADVVQYLVGQSNGLLVEDDLLPLPCSHPNCCHFTFVLRRRGSARQPLTRLVDFEKHMDRLSDRMNFNLDDAGRCCGKKGRAEDYFRILIKGFMDAHTYDQDRIDECCVHVIRPGGRAVSFCQFNTIDRNRSAGRSAGELVRVVAML